MIPGSWRSDDGTEEWRAAGGGRHRYRLFFASQGQQALEMVQEAIASDDPFLLAFVDMRMPPGWDGLETIEHLWRVDPRLQIVLCTAYSDSSWQEIQQRLGRTANLLILKKPVDVSEVAQTAATLTEKWHLTKQAATKEETLAGMVEDRTRALQETNQRLTQEIHERRQLEKQLLRAQKMEAVGTLAAGVAHDLNNILSGIVSYPDLLLLQVDETDPLHRHLKLIQQSGEKTAAIVQDMLALGRLGVVNYSPVDLKTTVEEYLRSPGFSALKRRHADVRIETRLASGVGSVDGSDAQLSKCLMNLVATAAEAQDAGGVVTIELAGRRIDAAHEGYVPIPPGRYVVISVVDNGPGIAASDLEHIFEPFYTKKRMGRSGTGLGLAVVWGVVRDHKGFIDVISREAAGTRFDLYLPETDAAAAGDASDAPVDLQEGKKASILVVDDVAEQREVAVALLQALGYQAVAVASGEEAIRHLEKIAVALLLLDMIMDPGIDGLETFQQALAINPFQRAVIASGYTRSDRVEKALALGASGFLCNPYQRHDLSRTVGEALKGTRV